MGINRLFGGCHAKFVRPSLKPIRPSLRKIHRKGAKNHRNALKNQAKGEKFDEMARNFIKRCAINVRCLRISAYRMPMNLCV